MSACPFIFQATPSGVQSNVVAAAGAMRLLQQEQNTAINAAHGATVMMAPLSSVRHGPDGSERAAGPGQQDRRREQGLVQGIRGRLNLARQPRWQKNASVLHEHTPNQLVYFIAVSIVAPGRGRARAMTCRREFKGGRRLIAVRSLDRDLPRLAETESVKLPFSAVQDCP